MQVTPSIPASFVSSASMLSFTDASSTVPLEGDHTTVAELVLASCAETSSRKS